MSSKHNLSCIQNPAGCWGPPEGSHLCLSSNQLDRGRALGICSPQGCPQSCLLFLLSCPAPFHLLPDNVPLSVHTRHVMLGGTGHLEFAVLKTALKAASCPLLCCAEVLLTSCHAKCCSVHHSCYTRLGGARPFVSAALKGSL